MRQQQVLDDLLSMQQKMDRLLSSTEAAIQEQDKSQSLPGWFPEVDIFESADRLIFQVELPGLAPEDINLSIEDQSLTLSGERQLSPPAADARQRQLERRYGPFRRTFRLPFSAAVEQVSAQCRDGLLEIIIPKKSSDRPRRIPVQNSDG